MLTGTLSILASLISLLYFFIDMYFARTEYLSAYFVLIGGYICTILLLRAGYYTGGRFIFLLSTLLILVLFSFLEPGNTGIYLYFVVVVVASMTIFGHDRLALGIGSAVVIIALFSVLYFFRWSSDIYELGEEYFKVTYGVNFIISLSLITLMIYYLIKINHITLSNIRETEKDLLKLTEELSESRNRFKLALKGSSAGIWDWDAVNDRLYMSPLLNSILGYSLEKTINARRQSFENIVHPEDLEHAVKALDDHLRERTKFEIELRVRRGTGEYIWVLDSGQAEWDDKGKPLRMVGSITDISERKAAEKKIQHQNLMLEKANAELDRFVYSVSHDLKSPLSSILGLMSIAEMSEDPQEMIKCIRMMRERVHALNGFIEEIIDYSRNTRTEPVLQEFSLYSMTEQVIEGLKYMENMQEIRIENKLDRGLNVVTDPGRLKIVMNNLIGNAVKYHNPAQDDPFIRIALSEESGLFHISISDNGQGIHKEIQKKIFDMFYRGHENSKGSGLGLYIAREMIRKLDGDIELFSERGVGSTFTVILPKKEPVRV